MIFRKNKMLQLKLEKKDNSGLELETPGGSVGKMRGETRDINANVVNTELSPETSCFFCGRQTTLLCRFCQRVYYCSEVTSHQLLNEI